MWLSKCILIAALAIISNSFVPLISGDVLDELESQILEYRRGEGTKVKPTIYGEVTTAKPFDEVYHRRNWNGRNFDRLPYPSTNPLALESQPRPFSRPLSTALYPSLSSLPPDSIYSADAPGILKYPVSGPGSSAAPGLPALPKQNSSLHNKGKNDWVFPYDGVDLFRYILSFGVGQYLPLGKKSSDNAAVDHQDNREYLQKISQRRGHNRGYNYNRKRRSHPDPQTLFELSPPVVGPPVAPPSDKEETRERRSANHYNQRPPPFNPYYRSGVHDPLQEYYAARLPDDAPYFDPNEQRRRIQIATSPYSGMSMGDQRLYDKVYGSGTGYNVPIIPKASPYAGWIDPKAKIPPVSSSMSTFGWVDPRIPVTTAPPPTIGYGNKYSWKKYPPGVASSGASSPISNSVLEQLKFLLQRIVV